MAPRLWISARIPIAAGASVLESRRRSSRVRSPCPCRQLQLRRRALVRCGHKTLVDESADPRAFLTRRLGREGSVIGAVHRTLRRARAAISDDGRSSRAHLLPAALSPLEVASDQGRRQAADIHLAHRRAQGAALVWLTMTISFSACGPKPYVIDQCGVVVRRGDIPGCPPAITVYPGASCRGAGGRFVPCPSRWRLPQ